MSVPIYSIQEGFLSFSNHEIFNNLELFLYPNDKICLIGRNGCGKSSLMKIISEIYELDSGELYQAPGVTIKYLEQDPKIEKSGIIYDFILTEIPKSERAEKEYLVDIILENLQLDGNLEMSALSGGQLRRSCLARVLLEEPNILLLDEPTNHLDISAIEWLENYIKSYKGSVVCISHDRKFLHNVTNKLWWLDRKNLRKSDKGFSHFDEWQEEVIAQEIRELEKLNRKVDEENLWLQQGVTGRRKRNVRRLGEVHRLRDQLRQENSKQNQRNQKIEVSNVESKKKTKFIIEAKDLFFSYDNKPMIKDFNIQIKRGEKIGLIGPNGAGKSTIIKLLTKGLEPSSGKVKHGMGLEISYFDQHRSSLNLDESLWYNLCPNGGTHVFFEDGKSMHVAAYLKKFMFDPKTIRDKASTLSGGQQSRLMLAKLLVKPGNFLILDEPTNDLDMDSLEVLYNILLDFNGTVLIVSHDRDFLDRLVGRTLIFDGKGEVINFIGGYEDYKKHYKPKEVTIKKKPKKQEEEVKNKIANPSKLSYKYQRLLEVLPSEIKDHEEEIKKIESELSNPDLYSKYPKKFNILSNRLLDLKKMIEEKEELWLEISG